MSYEVVLQNKYYLRELVEGITLKDSLDQISYQGTIQLKIPASFPGIEPGQEIRISGVPFSGGGGALQELAAKAWCICSTPASFGNAQARSSRQSI